MYIFWFLTDVLGVQNALNEFNFLHEGEVIERGVGGPAAPVEGQVSIEEVEEEEVEELAAEGSSRPCSRPRSSSPPSYHVHLPEDQVHCHALCTHQAAPLFTH